MNSESQLDNRLRLCASFVRRGAKAADIGTACDNFIANKGDITVRLGVELGTASTYTNECISVVVNKGLFPTVETYANNVSDGATIKQLMAWGVTDFTDDINPNCGLNW